MALPTDSLYARGFAVDGRTWHALREGLAGRKVKIQRGRLPVALRTLAIEPASKVLFVDLDGISDPAHAGRELAAVCAFETSVIAIGSTDSMEFTRVLFRHGIADYLVKPVSAGQIREASAALTDELPERAHAGRVIAFAGNAGSGTSTMVASVARAAAADGHMASVVDLDPVTGRLSELLSTHPEVSLTALFAALESDEASSSEPGAVPPSQVDEACSQAVEGISLVAYAPCTALPPSPNPTTVHKLLGHLANRTHLVLVTGFPDPAMQTEIMQQADARALLYEPTLSSLCSAARNLALLGTKHPTTLIQSSPRMPKGGLSSAHVRYALGDRRPDVVVPFDKSLYAVAAGGKPKTPGRAYRHAVRDVMARVLEGTGVVSGD